MKKRRRLAPPLHPLFAAEERKVKQIRRFADG
jgi:hypothetical protein